METLDFSVLLKEPSAVVSFSDKEQAEHFLLEVKRVYGKWFRSTPCPWKYGNKTVYYPGLKDGSTRMWYDNIDDINQDYRRVILYEELLSKRPDFGEIQYDGELSLLF